MLIPFVGVLVRSMTIPTTTTPKGSEEVSEADLWSALEVLAGTTPPPDPSCQEKPLVNLALTPPERTRSPTAIQRYLNPELFAGEYLNEVGAKLRDGEIVAIQDAFQEDFADKVHDLLKRESDWALLEKATKGGFLARTHIPRAFSRAWIHRKPVFAKLEKIFKDPETMEFMETLSSRDCQGDVAVQPTSYDPGDYLGPHHDHGGQRTVAYAWHLARDWLPEWGGALHWAHAKTHIHGFNHPTYNTLYLFNVRANSVHSVTPVSPHAPPRTRLCVSGWWHSNWLPKTIDDVLRILATPESRKLVTDAQRVAILPTILKASKMPTRDQLNDIIHGLKYILVDY